MITRRYWPELVLALSVVALVASCSTGRPQSLPSLPACDDLLVQKAFIDAVMPTDRIFEIKDWRATTDGKKWCYAFFPGSYLTGRHRTPYMQALYTLEWINEEEGRWWFQLKTLEQTCRGANGDRNSLERCEGGKR